MNANHYATCAVRVGRACNCVDIERHNQVKAHEPECMSNTMPFAPCDCYGLRVASRRGHERGREDAAKALADILDVWVRCKSIDPTTAEVLLAAARGDGEQA